MAIRTVKLGSTDWIKGENLVAIDLKDTFDELCAIIDNGNS